MTQPPSPHVNNTPVSKERQDENTTSPNPEAFPEGGIQYQQNVIGAFFGDQPGSGNDTNQQATNTGPVSSTNTPTHEDVQLAQLNLTDSDSGCSSHPLTVTTLQEEIPITIRNGVPDDAPEVLAMIKAIAAKSSAEVHATVDSMRASLSSTKKRKRIHCSVATYQGDDNAIWACKDGVPRSFKQGDILGMAIYWHTYSTWVGRVGMRLEDYYVKPEARGRAIGRKLLLRVVEYAVQAGNGRLEWFVHKNNKKVIEASKYIGALIHKEWLRARLTDDVVAKHAADAETSTFDGFVFGDAKGSDAAECMALIQELADYHDHEEVLFTTEKLASLLTKREQGKPSILGMLVVRDVALDNKIIGYAAYFDDYSTWRGRHGIHLEDLYVQPQYRGKGLGKALIQQMCKLTMSKSSRRLEWQVEASNKSGLRFYESIGATIGEEFINIRLPKTEREAIVESVSDSP